MKELSFREDCAQPTNILFKNAALAATGGIMWYLQFFFYAWGAAISLNTSPEVENFDDAIAHLKQHNVKFRMEPMECPPCRMAMVFDPDGNSICIHKRKTK